MRPVRRSAARRFAPSLCNRLPGWRDQFFDIRDNNLAKAARDNRQTIDHDAFLLGPSNIFLERRSPCPSDTAPINLLAFTVKQKQHPPVVDDAKRKMAFSQDDIAFPYRHSRAERAATHVVPGGCNICFNCCPVKYHIKDDKLVRVTGNEDDPQWQAKSAQNHNSCCNCITAQNG